MNKPAQFNSISVLGSKKGAN